MEKEVVKYIVEHDLTTMAIQNGYLTIRELNEFLSYRTGEEYE